MSTPHDTEKLAQRFMELWQRQLNATMGQPEMVGNMLQMMHTMNQSFDQAESNAQTHTTDPDLSSDGTTELAQLHRRIEELEHRVNQLESES